MKTLQEQMHEIFETESAEIREKVYQAMEDTAQKGVKILKQTTKNKRRGKYARGWFWKNKGKGVVIANREYQLTHLLEYGHDIVKNGKRVGRAKAYPHIKSAEILMTNELMEKIKK